MASYVPQRGDLIWLNFDPQVGHEQAGLRLAVVISSSSYNQKVGLLLCCPVTSRIKDYPFEVLIPKGLKVEGAILSDQIKNLDWKVRKARFIDRLPDDVTKEILAKVATLIQ